MENIIIWGTGKISFKFYNEIIKYSEINIIGFIDNDMKKQGGTFYGKEIYSPEILLNKHFDKIVVCTIYFDEIKRQITEDFLFAEEKIRNYKFFLYSQGIIARYKDSKDKEINEVISYIKRNDLKVFNYDFIDKYKDIIIKPVFDEINKMYYIKESGKKIYFASYLDSVEKVKNYYLGICAEQDEKSPHRYLTKSFNIVKNDIVVDVGVAEGNFALSVVDKVKKIYLVESKKEWIDALSLTFKDYLDKVVFINKYITNYSFGPFETLDNLINEPINLIKMDIEGNECDALDGIKKIVEMSPDIKLLISVYHNDYDEEVVNNKLSNMKFEYHNSNGYMWYPYKKTITTKLCRGLVRGVKKNEK